MAYAMLDLRRLLTPPSMKMINRWFLPTAFIGFSVVSAVAGPVVIDGTDANEHGSFNGVVNLNGWEYMQRALFNVAGQVGSPNRIIVDLGTSAGAARSAIDSAFAQSGLSGSGWSFVHIDGATNIATYLSGGLVGTTSLANTGLIYIPSAGLAAGDLTAVELSAINAGAAAIANFVGGAGNPATGGGLFAMGEADIGATGGDAFGWLTTLIPGIVHTDVGGGGIGTNITLTAAGTAAFPGLTNADLAGADPWHNYFSGNLGGLSVLGTAPDGTNTRNLILGGGAGTDIRGTPDAGSSILLLLAGLSALFAFRRKRNQ